MCAETEMAFLASRFLDRERAKIRAKAVTNLAGPLLKEIVDFGCSVYASCVRSAQKKNSHIPALFLYRHVLEMTDSIQVLVENSCAEPIVPLNRSAAEAVLSLEYLFGDYEHCSLIWRYHRLRKNLQQYDPTEQNEDIKRFLEKHVGKMGPQEEFELNMLREQVKGVEYQEIHERLQGSKVPNHWYQWVSDRNRKGPANFRDLLEKLEKPSVFYQMVCKPYSSVVHGDTYDYTEDLRHPGHLQEYAVNSALVTKHSIGLMVKKFMPDELDGFRAWFMRMKDQRDQLERVEVDFDAFR
jgi:hypothetical protein